MQEQTRLFQIIKQLQTPELCLEERLGIVSQLRELLGILNAHTTATKITKLVLVNQGKVTL